MELYEYFEAMIDMTVDMTEEQLDLIDMTVLAVVSQMDWEDRVGMEK